MAPCPPPAPRRNGTARPSADRQIPVICATGNNTPVPLFAHINNAVISGQLSAVRKTKKEPNANRRGQPAARRRGSRTKSHSPRSARRAHKQTGELFSVNSVLLFPNFFSACKDFPWNLESGILDAAIRPRCVLCGESRLCFSSAKHVAGSTASRNSSAQARSPAVCSTDEAPLNLLRVPNLGL